MEALDRIRMTNYVPDEADIVRVRVRTSGIKDEEISIGGVPFTVIDVGGQRGERRKWIHVFDNVRMVVFVAAISEYDQVLREDESKNRLQEAIDLFAMVSEASAFHDTAFLVMLNKYDLFEQKFDRKVGDMTQVFSDYRGGWDKDKAVDFIISKFLDVMPNPNKEVFFKVVSATEDHHVRTVLDVAREEILKDNLRFSDLMSGE